MQVPNSTVEVESGELSVAVPQLGLPRRERLGLPTDDDVKGSRAHLEGIAAPDDQVGASATRERVRGCPPLSGPKALC